MNFDIIFSILLGLFITVMAIGFVFIYGLYESILDTIRAMQKSFTDQEKLLRYTAEKMDDTGKPKLVVREKRKNRVVHVSEADIVERERKR